MHNGQRIKELIEARGLKKIEIAKKLGMTNQNLHDIFKRENVQIELLEAFSKILEVPLSTFISGYQDKFDKKDKELSAIDLLRSLCTTVQLLTEKVSQLEERFEQFQDKTKKEKAGSQ